MCVICGDVLFCDGCPDPWEEAFEEWVDENPDDADGVSFDNWKKDTKMDNAADAWEARRDSYDTV